MFKLKACPRCKGDLIVSQDRQYLIEQCLQCGYEHESRQIKSAHLRIDDNFDLAKAY